MPLPAAQPQHRRPGVAPAAPGRRPRRPAPGPVPRSGSAPTAASAASRKSTDEHHPPVVVLEDAGPVREPALLRASSSAPASVDPVVHLAPPTIVSATSWPYAPTFWIGVAPAEPGMPDRHSTPDQPVADRGRRRTSSHGSPAATRTGHVVVVLGRSTSTPRERSSTTVPGKPASPITTLLPPARISTGSARRVARTHLPRLRPRSVATRQPCRPGRPGAASCTPRANGGSRRLDGRR